MPIKEVIKSLLPRPLLVAIRSARFKNEAKRTRNQTNQQIFTKIYEESTWGTSNDPAQKFYSGSGSHQQEVVSTYIAAVSDFLSSLESKPDAVDLGCGDFRVGSSIRQLCNRYVACDVVPSLIEFNKERFKGLDVDFRVVDIAEDDLPKGDVVFVRQVLQHLSNEHISKALPKIASNYKFLVLTEHLPARRDFKPNLDKPAGPEVRLAVDSGVVVTSAPFGLKAKAERVLCDVPEQSPHGGRIRTTLYQFR
jgi:SAM-dependent methyltransferase